MRLLLACAALVLPGCATTPAGVDPRDGIARAGFNERVYVDGPYVTPLSLVEDSRCPVNARCVSAGRTRVMVRIDLGSRSEIRELCSDTPLRVADGALSLVEVWPERRVGHQPAEQKPYRFGFRFAGGL